jgi:hypothetical protein
MTKTIEDVLFDFASDLAKDECYSPADYEKYVSKALYEIEGLLVKKGGITHSTNKITFADGWNACCDEMLKKIRREKENE